MKAFVYGTLMTGFGNHRVVEQYVQGVVNAYILGFRLYDLGAFPCVTPSDNPTSTVQGQLLTLDDAALERMDMLEGYRAEREVGSMYLRRTTTTFAPNKVEGVAVYVWNQADRAKLRLIPDGDYRKFVAKV